MSIRASDVVGSWRLQRWVVEYPDGRAPQYPFGEDADGLLVYGADGWMSAFMSRRQRTPLSAPSARDASLASRAHAFEEILAYTGRWSMDGDELHHQVLLSLNPTLIGTRQVRTAQLHGNTMALQAVEADAGSGATRLHRIDWCRASVIR